MNERPNSSDRYYRRLAAIEQRVESLGARRDPDIADHLALLKRSPQSDSIANVLNSLLDQFEEDQRRAPNLLPEPPVEEDLNPDGSPPDFTVGETIETGVRYGPRIADDCGTIVVTGRPGGGKTNLAILIILGILACLRKVALLIFDLKIDMGCLLASGFRVVVVKAHEIRINVLKPPPGVDLMWWLRTMAHHLCEVRNLRKSRHPLLAAMLTVCRRFGVDKDPTRPWPSLVDVLEYLKTLKGGPWKREYLDSLIAELQGLLDETGSLFDTCGGLDGTDDIFVPGTAFVFQIEMLPAAAQRFLVSLLVEYAMAYQMARGIHTTVLQILVVIEETQVILSSAADAASADGTAPLAIDVLRGRELGIGFLLIVHELARISLAVLAAARIRFIVGSLGDAADILIAGRMMNLSQQALPVFTHLGVGEAVVQEVGAPFSDPYLLAIDPPPIPKNAIDEKTRRKLMKPVLDTFDHTPSRPLSDYPPKPTPPPRPSAGGPTSTSDNVLTPEEQRVLLDCARNADDLATERQKRLGLTDFRVLQRTRDRLEALTFIRTHALRLGSTGVELWEVLDAGWAAAGLQRPNGYNSKGSFPHTVIVRRLARHLKDQGWTKVQIEHPVGPNNHLVDLCGRSPEGVFTGFEVTLSTDNVVDNARNCLGLAGVERLTFLCLLQKDARKVTGLLQEAADLADVMPRITVRRIDELLF